MYKIHKSVYKYLLLIVLLSILIIGIFIFFNKKETILSIKDNEVTLTYNYDGKSHTVKGQSIEADEAIHIFIPSFYKLDNIAIDSSDGNDYTITQGYYYQDSFSKDIVNENQVSKAIKVSTNNIDIIIHHLENQSLFIDLDKPYTLSDIINDKELEVASKIVNIDNYGNINFDGRLEHIKGRGNSSWDYPKHGYLLSFNKDTELSNLGLNKKYVLVASYYDMTGIRNKLVYDYGKNIGLDKTPNSEFVNLFVNGEYHGLYLLCPHISKNVNDFGIQNINGLLKYKNDNIDDLKQIKYFENASESKTKTYIIEKDRLLDYTLEEDAAGFITKRGEAYKIHNSRDMSYDEVYSIARTFQKLEDKINDETNADFINMIDIETWAKRYLIEEIFQNFDVTHTSFYYYINRDEPNKVYAGPIWDYDFSIGIGSAQTQEPKTLMLKYISNENIVSKLSSRKEFMDIVIDYFKNELYPNINELIYTDTYRLATTVKNDMYLNAILYNQQRFIDLCFNFDIYDYDGSINKLQGHLFEHTNYMNKIYKDYYNQIGVIFHTNNDYLGDICFLVENGHSFIQDNKVPYYSNGNGFVWNKPLWISKWVDSDGKEFDFTKPITKDIDLYAVWEGDTDAYILQK